MQQQMTRFLASERMDIESTLFFAAWIVLTNLLREQNHSFSATTALMPRLVGLITKVTTTDRWYILLFVLLLLRFICKSILALL